MPNRGRPRDPRTLITQSYVLPRRDREYLDVLRARWNLESLSAALRRVVSDFRVRHGDGEPTEDLDSKNGQ